MGYYVHISITYSASLDKKLPSLVEKHKKEDMCREAKDYLEEVLDTKNYNCGWKGELFTWGYIGNYTQVEEFVEQLSPFFEELLREEIGIFGFDHIIVFYEQEQTEQAKCIEVYLDELKGGGYGEFKTKKHELPFKWNQF